LISKSLEPRLRALSSSGYLSSFFSHISSPLSFFPSTFRTFFSPSKRTFFSPGKSLLNSQHLWTAILYFLPPSDGDLNGLLLVILPFRVSFPPFPTLRAPFFSSRGSSQSSGFHRFAEDPSTFFNPLPPVVLELLLRELRCAPLFLVVFDKVFFSLSRYEALSLFSFPQQISSPSFLR